MILVTAGVGAILPIVGVIVGGETDTDGQFVSAIKELIGISNQRAMLIVLVVGFFILIALKVIVGLWVLVEQKKLNAAIRLSVTDRLFRHLMGMPYSFIPARIQPMHLEVSHRMFRPTADVLSPPSQSQVRRYW